MPTLKKTYIKGLEKSKSKTQAVQQLKYNFSQKSNCKEFGKFHHLQKVILKDPDLDKSLYTGDKDKAKTNIE